MNKLSIAVLLLSSLYLATALSDAPWAPLARGVFENSPFTIGLTDIGGQNTVGQALDSGIFNVAQGQFGQVLNAWHQADDRGFTYIAEPQLVLEDGSLHSSKYAIRIDPESGRREVVWWSVQQLLEDNFLPTGRNITWNGDTDAVTVTSFEGLDQFLQYQGLQPFRDSNSTDVIVNATENTDVLVNDTDTDAANVIVNGTNNPDVVVNSSDPNVEVFDSWGAYLQNFAGFEPQNAQTYTQNELFTNAINNAIGQISGTGNLPNLVLNNLTTLDTLPTVDDNTVVRLSGDVTSDVSSGNLVAVIACSVAANCDNGNLQYWYWNNVLLA